MPLILQLSIGRKGVEFFLGKENTSRDAELLSETERAGPIGFTLPTEDRGR